MVDFLIELLINAVVVFIAAKLMPRVELRNFGAALLVALLYGLLSPTVGWFLEHVLYVVSLGILWILGFITRLIVAAIIIKLVDWLVGGFKVHGFLTAILLAVILALVGTVVGWIF